jgi:hypothetical protein
MSSGLRCRIAGNEKNLRRLTVRSGGVFLFRVVVEAFRRTGVQVDLVAKVDLVDVHFASSFRLPTSPLA